MEPEARIQAGLNLIERLVTAGLAEEIVISLATTEHPSLARNWDMVAMQLRYAAQEAGIANA